MALTPEQVQAYRQKYGIGTASAPSSTSFASGVASDFASRVDKAADAQVKATEGGQSNGSAVLQTLGQGAGFVSDLIGRGLSALTPEFIKEPLKKGAEAVAETETVQDTVRKYQSWKADNPEASANLEAFLNIGSLLPIPPIAKGVQTGTEVVLRTGKEGVESAVDLAKKGARAAEPALDVATGLGRQATDFAVRTGRTAQETAERARVLKQLPEPEANLLRSGADDRIVNVIKDAPKQEVNIYRELVAQAKRKEIDPTPNTALPKEIAGREFLRPVSYLLKERDSIGAKLGEVRRKLSNAPLDITPQFRQFQQYLNQSLGIYVDSKGRFVPTRGKVAQSDLNEIQKLYDELRPDNTGKVIRSQKWVDEWSQRTFKDYDIRQAREQTFGDDVTRTAERARSIFKQSLPKEYQTLSTEYATTMKPIQDMVKLLGYKGDIEKLTEKELKAGEVALRILGNASDRPQSVINDVLEVAQRRGYTSDVDLNRLIYVTDQLEDLYDITPSRGFSGSTARGIDQSGVGALTDTATLNVPGLFNRVLNSSASKKEVQEAFEAFLESLATQ